jgi:hypothetical protein
MNRKTRKARATPEKPSSGPITVIDSHSTANGGQSWRVVESGQAKTYVTSSSSATVITEAAIKYRTALDILAKK